MVINVTAVITRVDRNKRGFRECDKPRATIRRVDVHLTRTWTERRVLWFHHDIVRSTSLFSPRCLCASPTVVKTQQLSVPFGILSIAIAWFSPGRFPRRLEFHVPKPLFHKIIVGPLPRRSTCCHHFTIHRLRRPTLPWAPIFLVCLHCSNRTADKWHGCSEVKVLRV